MSNNLRPNDPSPRVEEWIRREANANIYGALAFLLVFTLGIAYLVVTPGPLARLKHEIPDASIQQILLIGAGLVAALFPLLCLSSILTGWKALSDPYSHRALQRWPQIGSPREIAHLLNEEMERSEGHAKLHGLRFGADWMFYAGILSAIPYSEIAWVYNKATWHATGVVPTGKECAVVVNTRDGQPHVFGLGGIIAQGDKHSEELLQEIRRHAPQATYGFSDDLERQWQTDRVNFPRAQR